MHFYYCNFVSGGNINVAEGLVTGALNRACKPEKRLLLFGKREENTEGMNAAKIQRGREDQSVGRLRHFLLAASREK